MSKPKRTPALCSNHQKQAKPTALVIVPFLVDNRKPLYNRDLGNVASLETLLDTLRERNRDARPHLVDIGTGDRGLETKSGIHDIAVQTEETLRDAVGSGVLVVERGDEGGVVAGRVELVVDSALWEDGSLEFVERADDFLCEAVFEDHACGEGAVDDGQELVAARVDVGRVHAAGGEGGDGGGETHCVEEGEGVDCRGLFLSTEFARRRDGVAEVED